MSLAQQGRSGGASDNDVGSAGGVDGGGAMQGKAARADRGFELGEAVLRGPPRGGVSHEADGGDGFGAMQQREREQNEGEAGKEAHDRE